MTVTRAQPPAGYTLVGEGEHSRVFRPDPGSGLCVQYFKAQAPELTPDKIEEEYAYLVQVYSSRCPQLLPSQVLIRPSPDAALCQMVLVKEWVQVHPTVRLNLSTRAELPATALADLHGFITLTRELLERVSREQVLLPDIIDYRFQNLCVDSAGRVRLVDTNRLINTNALRKLAPGRSLDLDRRWIHGRLLRRLMYLEAAFGGRTRGDLLGDGLYRRYLDQDTMHRLFEDSRAEGEML
ncbi:hypothetical protein [Nocardiopsis sp. JB363]|uniref:hypothetical protein n=1 Tax=Nocardiopsis sp. JB363 TaxID=1434837 RepID=UPI00097B4150|nr:hypothetical protein [Nocardiopsis sp. JB363]SIO90789.1 hypothetical protein BQ8420_28455 [Nocardiopsis sp. JB363]